MCANIQRAKDCSGVPAMNGVELTQYVHRLYRTAEGCSVHLQAERRLHNPERYPRRVTMQCGSARHMPIYADGLSLITSLMYILMKRSYEHFENLSNYSSSVRTALVRLRWSALIA